MKMNKISIFLSFLVCGCGSMEKSGSDAITYGNIEKHIVALSSDTFRGRMPMTTEEPAIINYIADQMKEIGLEPTGSGSYFQNVPILKVTSKISTTLAVKTPAGVLQLEKLVDYVSFTRKESPQLALENSDLIFAGFGITAPEFQRNDFEGVDVRGKTILVFVNDPGYGTDGSYFKGNEMTYYGRWTYKFEEAARRGARACFIIHEDGPAGYGWNVVSNNGETTKLYLQPEDGYQGRCDLEGWISLNSARKLFASCGMNLEEVKKEAVSKNFKAFKLPVTVSGWIKNEFQTGESHNVCGMIKGTTTPDEVVVYTAHWDHLGVGTVIRGDSIYNGATDNASGVAWLLEIARAFKAGTPANRSVLFISPTGEESGLLGSEYYTEHPFFNMNKTVACLNTDVTLFLGNYKDITLTGSGQSELDTLVGKAARTCGRYVASDPNPEKGMFFRSDQFPFVRKGVPAIFAKGYVDAEKYGREKTAEIIETYWKSVYHTPQDEYVQGRDDLGGLVEDAKLLYSVGYDLANSTAWPQFYDTSEFKSLAATRGKRRDSD
jgi:Zn-dependent M28 family amino/carboxypeptidase